MLTFIISASLLPSIKLRHQGEEKVEVKVIFAGREVNEKDGRKRWGQWTLKRDHVVKGT